MLFFGATFVLTSRSLFACPFCQATSQTLSEEMRTADVVVLARVVKLPPPPEVNADGSGGFAPYDPNAGNATFEIVEILRGEERLDGKKEFDVVYFGGSNKDNVFMVSGLATDRIDWTTPLPLSAEGEKYIRAIGNLPEGGPDRITFFQDYLESDDPLLSQDAYDEFARAPYADLIAMRDRMRHDELVDWILNPDVPPSRRRLYLTMLGVCGGEGDVELLEHLIRPADVENRLAIDVMVSAPLTPLPELYRAMLHDLASRHEQIKRQGLDALIACYLKLGGPDCLPLIDTLFLSDPNTDYKDVFSAIMALRFHGEETDVIPRERLLESMRLILDNPTFADQIIPDLARWEDWSVLDRLVQMFKDADETSYVRQPVVTYMTVASEQEGDVGERATQALKTLEEIDPETVDRARSLLAFGALARARPPSDEPTDGAADDASEQLATSADSEEAPTDPIADAVADVELKVEPHPSDSIGARNTGAEAVAADGAAGAGQADNAEGERGAPEAAADSATDEPLVVDDLAARELAEKEAAGRIAKRAADVTAEELTPPRPVWVVTVPIVTGALLMAGIWLILRAPSSRA